MSLVPVVRIGDPVLRSVAAPIADPTDPEVRALAGAMVETMIAAPGVGLAAPQVGQSVRLIVMRLMESRGQAEGPIRVAALVNPEWEPLDDTLELGWEGCLSVPELRGLVPRHRSIRYRGWTIAGDRVEADAHGFQARILQHEVDHLDGVIYLDRMRDLASLGYGPEIMAAAESQAEARAQAEARI